MEDRLKTKLLTMRVGEMYDNRERLSEKILISYGFLWYEKPGVWIKMFS